MLLASSLMLCYQYKRQIENLIIGEGRFGLEALSTDSMRFIAKRLSGLLKYQYSIGQQGLSEHLIEVQLVEELYSHLLKYFLENGLVEPSFLSSREVILFYSDKPEFFILPNGSLFMSESLLEQLLTKVESGGIEALTFLFVHELSHIVKGHLQKNLMQTQHYGDLRN